MVEGRIWRKALRASSVSITVISILAIDSVVLVDGVV